MYSIVFIIYELSSARRLARIGFKRCATAVLKSNLIRSIEFSTAVARRLSNDRFSKNYLMPGVHVDFYLNSVQLNLELDISPQF